MKLFSNFSYESIAEKKSLNLEDIFGDSLSPDSSDIKIKEVEDPGYWNKCSITIECAGEETEITDRLIMESVANLKGNSATLNPLADFERIIDLAVKKGDVVNLHTTIAYYCRDPRKRMAEFVSRSEDLLKKYHDRNSLPPKNRGELKDIIDNICRILEKCEKSRSPTKKDYDKLLDFISNLTRYSLKKFLKKESYDKILQYFSYIDDAISNGDLKEIKSDMAFIKLIKDKDSILRKILENTDEELVELEESIETLLHEADISKCDEFFESAVTEFYKLYIESKDLHCDSLTNLCLICAIDFNVCPNLNYIKNYKIGILSNFSFYWIFSILCISILFNSGNTQLGWLWLIINIGQEVKDFATISAVKNIVEPVFAATSFPRKGFRKHIQYITIHSAINNLRAIRSEIATNCYSKIRVGEKLRQIEASGYKLPSIIYKILEMPTS